MSRQPTATAATPPQFDATFRSSLEYLLAWRRDVRRFRTDAVEPALLDRLLDLACLAPSVGNSQPWRFVKVDAPRRRAAVVANFHHCNAAALAGYSGEQAKLYAELKLQGLDKAPVHLAAFCDGQTAQGHGLGQGTMPETLRYSVVAALHTLWLAARANGLGVGWLSILDPAALATALEAPAGWSFVGYLCLGWPEAEHPDPELERQGWQARERASRHILQR